MAASLLLLEENQRAIWGVYDAVSLFSVLTTMARHKDPVEVLLTRVRSVSMAGWGGGGFNVNYIPNDEALSTPRRREKKRLVRASLG